jgi:hypothetical protein
MSCTRVAASRTRQESDESALEYAAHPCCCCWKAIACCTSSHVHIAHEQRHGCVVLEVIWVRAQAGRAAAKGQIG